MSSAVRWLREASRISNTRMRGCVTFRPALRSSRDSTRSPASFPGCLSGIAAHRTACGQAPSVSSALSAPKFFPMRKPILLLLFVVLGLALGGCSVIYKPDVQQGNLLDTKNVQQLKPGMSKQQVLALLGTPSVSSPFAQNRWDYVATLQKRGGKVLERTLTLYFNNDTLVRTDGDFLKETPQELLQEIGRASCRERMRIAVVRG